MIPAFCTDVPLPGDSESWLFDTWEGVWRVLLSASLAYAATALLFRLAGTRSASQMNNFDWVVTVAMGAIVGATALRKGTVVAEGAAAVVALLFWQWLLNFTAVRSGWFHDLMFHTPRLLYHDGEFLRAAMRSQRISEAEVLRAVRLAGKSSLGEVSAVVLEPGGELSVIGGGDGPGRDVLGDVAGDV